MKVDVLDSYFDKATVEIEPADDHARVCLSIPLGDSCVFLTPQQAREIAASLVCVADEVGRMEAKG